MKLRPFKTPSLNFAQTFYVDKDFFKGAKEIGLTRVTLYFKRKPRRTKNNSGIDNPGVTIFISPCRGEGQKPMHNRIVVGGRARAEWGEIIATRDASVGTDFYFRAPVEVETNTKYAIMINFDGDEDFELWSSKEGDILVGTNTRTAGPAGKYIGDFFEFDPEGYANGGPGAAPAAWRPLKDTDLKFTVYAAYYTGFVANGQTNAMSGSVSDDMYGTFQYVVRSDRAEHFGYSVVNSVNVDRVRGGDYVFQNNVLETGTVHISRNSNIVNATGINFNTLFSDQDEDQYLVVKVSADQYVVRLIESIQTNTTLILDKPPGFTNTAASIMRAPVAKFRNKYTESRWQDYRDGLFLYDSNANSTVRFVSNTVESANITAGGSSYVNGDILRVVSAGSNGYNAVATVVTNSTGGITSLTFSNTGAKINTGPTYAITNSTGGSTTGSSATVTFGIGATLLTQRANTKFANAVLLNYPFEGVRWMGRVPRKEGMIANSTFRYKYYIDATANSQTDNVQYYATKQTVTLPSVQPVNIRTDDSPIALSWSNRVLFGAGSNNSWDDTDLVVNIESNNPWVIPALYNTRWYLTTNFINNNYTNEHTRRGSARSRHISKKIRFEQDRFADDLIVYIRAHRPANTDIKVYAKLHNSHDSEAFDDKNWTLLECTDGQNQFSSKTNLNDLYEYTYTIPTTPNIEFTSVGSITTTLNNTEINGTGTAFDTDYVSGDLVKIYSPLFTENFLITVVNTVTNATHLTIDRAVTNNSIVGSGFKIQKIEFKNQAFLNGQNDNVVRYYTSTMAEYDTFDTFAIKLVLISPNRAVAPSVDDIRAVGVSS